MTRIPPWRWSPQSPPPDGVGQPRAELGAGFISFRPRKYPKKRKLFPLMARDTLTRRSAQGCFHALRRAGSRPCTAKEPVGCGLAGQSLRPGS